MQSVRDGVKEAPEPSTTDGLPQSARAKLDREQRKKLRRGMRATCERVCRPPPIGTPRALLWRWLREKDEAADAVRARLGIR
jgi:hypothetical protein